MEGRRMKETLPEPLVSESEIGGERELLDALSFSQYRRSSNHEYVIPCIHRIPDGIRKLNKTAYNPICVSIGPLHRSTYPLYEMEDVKKSYTTRLLQRAPFNQQELDTCLAAVKNFEVPARECYAEELTQLNGSMFAEMMLFDCCFIIELLLRFHDNTPDPILHNTFKHVAVRHDLLLLENQIPFFILQDLFRQMVELRHLDYPSLTQCLLSFFDDMMGLEKLVQTGKKGQTNYCAFDSNLMPSQTEAVAAAAGKDTKKGKEKEIKEEEEEYAETAVRHILDLLHKRCLMNSTSHHVKAHTPEEKKDTGTSDDDCHCIVLQISQKHSAASAKEAAVGKDKSTREETWDAFKYSATQLDMAGVKLMAGNRKDLFDVNFSTDDRSCFWLCRRGRLEIPPFSVDDFTETFLRNIIAFEQTCVDIQRYFTSHALLMDKLINSPEDVKLLEEAGIICNNLGSSEEVALLFNHICKNVSPSVFCFQDQCIKVVNYCKKSWPNF